MRTPRLALVSATSIAACRGGEPRATRPAPPRAPDAGPVAPAPVAAIDARPAVAAIDARPAVAAVDARPPAPDDWVDVARAIPDAVLDLRYATADNFTHVALYPVARCLLRRSVAERLAIAADALRAAHRRLLLWDCYRPAALQQKLWDLVPDPRYVARPRYAADGTPQSGSRHSRGAAVDVGLVDEAGAPVTLPTEFDDFTRAAHRASARRGAGKAELATLEAALTGAGFVGLTTEWWHYDAPDAGRFPLADAPLDAELP